MAADVQLSFSCLVFLLIFSVNSIIIALGISDTKHHTTTRETMMIMMELCHQIFFDLGLFLEVELRDFPFLFQLLMLHFSKNSFIHSIVHISHHHRPRSSSYQRIAKQANQPARNFFLRLDGWIAALFLMLFPSSSPVYRPTTKQAKVSFFYFHFFLQCWMDTLTFFLSVREAIAIILFFSWNIFCQFPNTAQDIRWWYRNSKFSQVVKKAIYKSVRWHHRHTHRQNIGSSKKSVIGVVKKGSYLFFGKAKLGVGCWMGRKSCWICMYQRGTLL